MESSRSGCPTHWRPSAAQMKCIVREKRDVYLYYRLINRFTLCVVTRHLNGDGFIITAYLTTKKKRKGIQVWFKTTTSNSSSIPTATP